MSFSRLKYEALLSRVEKPGRYLGNERGAVSKDRRGVALRFALAFPEVYEISQSHPGLQILYDLLNRRADVSAERAYAPWIDLEALLREHRQPLVSLESFTPLADFDIVGFSLQYELTYTNILTMLDLGGIPLRGADRAATDPLVIGGGPCAFNPEPLADFFDAFLLGDGEQAVGEICDAVLAWNGADRTALLRSLADVPGVYVPSLYGPEYDGRGRLITVRPLADDLPAVVEKRVLRDLNEVPVPETFVVPNVKVVHGRPSLEVMRGCVKGCRFCQAGYIYRPLRERDPRRVLEEAERAVAATGTDELSLLSLSTGDYSCVNPLLTELMNKFAADRIAVSLPSTRVDALAPSLLDQIRRVRKTGFTLAPEAGSQRMRDIIQKEYQEDELIEAARQMFALGWRSLKLYFMLGLPGEAEADLVGIADLAAKVAAAGGGRAEVTASVSTFVPKPHTPFQWSAQIDVAETEARQQLLRRELSRRRIRFKWHDAQTSYLEGIFSRGDRRLGALLIAAYRLGCRFDGWTDQCRVDLWQRALEETGIDANALLGRRHLDEVLPWDHISSGVTKAFLQRELSRAVEGKLTPDCSVERCTYCGACDFERIKNVDYHVRGAKGGQHRGEVVDNWAQVVVGEGEESGSWEPRGWHKIRDRVEGRVLPPAADAGAAPAVATPIPAGATGGERDSLPARGLGNAEEWLSASAEGLAPPPPAAAEPPLKRVRILYWKRGRGRFISHLELIDVFTRALRRARLPVAFSGGHHPLPRLRFSPGLPLGAESDCEVIDVDLTEPLVDEDVARRLAPQLPEGLGIVSLRDVSLREASPDRHLSGFRYLVGVESLHDGDGGAWIDERLAAFLGAATFPVLKRRPKGHKQIDARKLVTRLERVDPGHVELDLRFTIEGSIKPSDFLAAILGLDAAVVRTLPLRKTDAFYEREGGRDAGERQP
jgi:radical SAM family uncharacterized protein/radical SAM-linked protein